MSEVGAPKEGDNTMLFLSCHVISMDHRDDAQERHTMCEGRHVCSDGVVRHDRAGQ